MLLQVDVFALGGDGMVSISCWGLDNPKARGSESSIISVNQFKWYASFL